MKKYAFLFLSFVALFLFQHSEAQDSLKVQSEVSAAADTSKQKIHSPLFAGLASAVIPGGGQIYNHKYWKVPIVYAALGTAAYFAYYNADVYFTVHDNLNSRVSGDSVPQPQYLILNNIFSKTTIDLNNYSYDDLIQVQDDYRRYFTLSIIAGTVIYVLNILDAVVDAHLFYFDVSDELAMNIRPQLLTASNYRPVPGFSVSLNLH